MMGQAARNIAPGLWLCFSLVFSLRRTLTHKQSSPSPSSAHPRRRLYRQHYLVLYERALIDEPLLDRPTRVGRKVDVGL
jgi:hypothetical protein